MHRLLTAAAGAGLTALLLTSCASEPNASGEQPATAETQEGATDSAQTETPDTQESSPSSTSADKPEFAEGPVSAEDALHIFDSPREGVVPAPDGEMWPLHGSFDMDVLREHFDATLHMTTYNSDCADLGSVYYMWLREDGYGSGPESGPTCFGEHGGRVDSQELRLTDFVCQAPNTTARTLIVPTIPAEGSDSLAAVFTPEHTTASTWECFDFDGEEVAGDQTVVTTAEN